MSDLNNFFAEMFLRLVSLFNALDQEMYCRQPNVYLLSVRAVLNKRFLGNSGPTISSVCVLFNYFVNVISIYWIYSSCELWHRHVILCKEYFEKFQDIQKLFYISTSGPKMFHITTELATCNVHSKSVVHRTSESVVLCFNSTDYYMI